MIQILILLFGVGILSAYWYSRRSENYLPMSLANLFLNPPIIALLILSGAWGATLLPFGFVLIEALELRRKRRSKRLLNVENAAV